MTEDAGGAHDRPRLLVVDDEPDIRDLLASYLERQGFEVATVGDGAAMRAALAAKRFDLVLLDVGLPGESGLELARSLRGPNAPGLVFVTAAGAVPERLAGLAVGADDYVSKPFEPRELLARIRSVLRRLSAEPRGPEPDTATLPFGRCRLDVDGRRLLGPDGTELPVTAMEWDLLLAFARHPRQVLSRRQLCRLAHDRELDADERSIDVRIARLRKKIEADPARPTTIRTVRGEGYSFDPDGGQVGPPQPQ